MTISVPMRPGPAPRKRSGALWALEARGVRGRMPIPLAACVAACITLAGAALLAALSSLTHKGLTAAEAPLVTRVALVDSPPAQSLPATAQRPHPAALSPVPPHAARPLPIPLPATPLRMPGAAIAPAQTVAADMPLAPPANTPPSVAPASDNNAAATAGAAQAVAAATTPAAAPQIGIICPHQAKPEMPMAARRDGLTGTVRARIVVQNGVVTDVTMLTGPKVFHAAVKAAVLQYRCNESAQAQTTTQDFAFTLDPE